MRAFLLCGVLLLGGACGPGGSVNPRGQSGARTDAAEPLAASAFDASAVRDALAEAGAGQRESTSPVSRDLAKLYAGRPDAFVWLTQAGQTTPDARAALTLLANAAADGLDPADYDATLLAGLAVDIDTTGTARRAPTDSRGLPPTTLARFDVELSRAMLRYFRHLHLGRVDPRSLGLQIVVAHETHDFAAVLGDAVDRDRIAETAESLRPPFFQYAALARELTRYRTLAASNGAPPAPGTAVPLTWRIRQIELALERLRWLPDIAGGRLIAVNIPMFRLWAWDRVPSSAPPALDMPVVVGRALDTRTPIFADRMEYLIFRPYWNVPASILRREIAPAIRKDAGYLTREALEIVNGQTDASPVVAPTPDAMASLGRSHLRVRQRPGPNNSLGLVKFMFPNQNDVYMHGTPAPQLFSRDRRDFSHGCIRVADPAALATWVLGPDGGWSRERVVAAMNGADNTRVDLPQPIQVLIFYTTAVVMPEDGRVHFAEDVYKQDAPLDRALATRDRSR